MVATDGRNGSSCGRLNEGEPSPVLFSEPSLVRDRVPSFEIRLERVHRPRPAAVHVLIVRLAREVMVGEANDRPAGLQPRHRSSTHQRAITTTPHVVGGARNETPETDPSTTPQPTSSPTGSNDKTRRPGSAYPAIALPGTTRLDHINYSTSTSNTGLGARGTKAMCRGIGRFGRGLGVPRVVSAPSARAGGISLTLLRPFRP